MIWQELCDLLFPNIVAQFLVHKLALLCLYFFFPPSFNFIKRYGPSPMAEAHIQRPTLLLIGQPNKTHQTLSPNWQPRPKPTYSNPSPTDSGNAGVEEAEARHVWRSWPSVRHASLRLDPTVTAFPSRRTQPLKISVRRSSESLRASTETTSLLHHTENLSESIIPLWRAPPTANLQP